jgi:hypothetical protein
MRVVTSRKHDAQSYALTQSHTSAAHVPTYHGGSERRRAAATLQHLGREIATLHPRPTIEAVEAVHDFVANVQRVLARWHVTQVPCEVVQYRHLSQKRRTENVDRWTLTRPRHTGVVLTRAQGVKTTGAAAQGYALAISAWDTVNLHAGVVE